MVIKLKNISTDNSVIVETNGLNDRANDQSGIHRVTFDVSRLSFHLKSENGKFDGEDCQLNVLDGEYGHLTLEARGNSELDYLISAFQLAADKLLEIKNGRH